jgi:hypothetical protein
MIPAGNFVEALMTLTANELEVALMRSGTNTPEGDLSSRYGGEKHTFVAVVYQLKHGIIDSFPPHLYEGNDSETLVAHVLKLWPFSGVYVEWLTSLQLEKWQPLAAGTNPYLDKGENDTETMQTTR